MMNKQLLAMAIFIVTAALSSCGEAKFTKLKSGIEYKIVKKGKGGKKATEGSMVTMHMKTMLKDSVLFDSYKMNNGEPVPATVTKPSFNGDLMEGIALLSEGDSAVIRIIVDSLFRGSALPEFIKTGDTMQFAVKMVSVKTEAEFKKSQEEAASKQNGIDDKAIQEYLTKNNIKAEKTATGIYYVIERTGNGKHATASDLVKVNYSGTLLDGTKFDSSYDRGEPAEFPLGQVIKGWTQGIPMFEEGGKGKLIIPSSLAYGQTPPQGSPIKPNSILVFDIELLKISPMPAQGEAPTEAPQQK
jgi:FKBP-type peptidyl-prolyl cis-trans isomerase FkpA